MKLIKPKKTIERINNNKMFHPEAPTYKDNFAFAPFGKGEPAFYVHISPTGSFLAGGLYHPDNDTLKKIRGAIDYNGKELIKINKKKSFQDFFGGLAEDEDMLKTSPRDYSQDHKHIELLRRKNFVAMRSLTQKEILSKDFVDLVEKAFKELQPLRQYLHKAMTF